MTDATVDLDELEAECQRRLEHAGKFRNFIPFMNIDARQLSALIAELRAARAPGATCEARGAARAVSQEASELRAEPPLIPSHVMEAHRQTYLKALEAVELVANILAKDAGAETRNVHQFYAQAVAKLRDGVTPERPAPPADEVAGRVADCAALTRYLGVEDGDDRPWAHEAQAAVGRIENHLKGKR